MAVSPPPTTAISLPRKKKPSQVAQVETPCPMSLRSASRPSIRAEAPAATIESWRDRSLCAVGVERACGRGRHSVTAPTRNQRQSVVPACAFSRSTPDRVCLREIRGSFPPWWYQSQLAAGFITINYQWLEVGSRGIDCGGQAGAPAPDNDHVVHGKSSSIKSESRGRKSFAIAGTCSKVL